MSIVFVWNKKYLIKWYIKEDIWQPTPVFFPGESQGKGEPDGLPSMGSHRVGHDWSDLAAAAAAMYYTACYESKNKW